VRKGKPLSSANALAAVAGAGPRKTVRRKKPVVNDENKENCGGPAMGLRRSVLGVNGNHSEGKKPVQSKIERNGRLPLKELRLNGFLDRLRKREVAPSVEVVVCPSSYRR